ncbi:hypothetical protein AC1031_013305 [Aphanomyces cochlioides]|nr:hypothetical protein AC1031_013305 [Aphanomyces cochlioides]
MSATNFFYCEMKRGSYKSDGANEWLRRMLRSAIESIGSFNDIVVIPDNAPCHSKLSRVIQDDEFFGVQLLKLSPYSPMLNPIENLWSSMKAFIDTHLRQGLAAFLGRPPDGQTREEFRIQYLEHIARDAIRAVDTSGFGRYIIRLDRLYGIAEALGNMEVGA